MLPYLATQTWTLYRKLAVKEQMRSEMMRKTDREELVLLSFDVDVVATQLRWEHSREFEFDGKMFDVVETETCDGLVHYWCFQDGAETSLNHLLEELVAFATATDASNQNESSSSPLDFYASLFIEEGEEQCLILVGSADEHFLLQAIEPDSFLQSPETPPPDRG